MGAASAPLQVRQQWLGAFGHLAETDRPSLRFLADALDAKLASYGSSLSDDEALLERTERTASSARLRCAVVVRMAEKRALERWLRMVHGRVANLGPYGPGEDAANRMKAARDEL